MEIKRILLSLVVGLVSHVGNAQLCQGSLGDPIVNITFGAGSNPGPPLNAATTNYQYLTTDCPNDGQYAVRNRTDACYTTWHTLNSDHTGNSGGYFMLVNASFQPSAFYVDTVDLFCGNTVYEFAAWAINMMRTTLCSGNPTILPNLTFNIENIDGTIIQTYNTGNIPIVPTATWTQYGFFFSAPAGVNRIVLRIINNAPGGCGNDIAIDDITFRPCGPEVTGAINAGGNNHVVCKGNSEQLTLSAVVSSGFTDPVMQWQISTDNGSSWTDLPGENASSMQVDITQATPVGTYLYRMTVVESENVGIALCRVNSDVLTIQVTDIPEISFNTNGPVCENSPLELNASGGTTYQWTGPNSFSSTQASLLFPDAQVAMSGKYYVVATDANSCANIDSIIVDVNPRPLATANPEAISICEGTSTTLSSAGGSEYVWLPVDGLSSSTIADPIASPVDSTDYMVIVSNAFGCKDTAYSSVNVLRLPVANAGPDRELFEGESIVLNGTVSGTSVAFEWSPDYLINDVSILKPEVRPLADTSYILTVTSEVGCGIISDTVKVKVYKGIFIPTAFSPNNDGLNDVWRVPGLGIFNDHQVLVFNRYGQVVFSTKSNQSWDGRFKGIPQPIGVYPYLITVKEKNLILKGWITIVR